MNINDKYFSNIIYQADALANLSGILKSDFSSKKVLFISSKTAYQKFGTGVVNEFNRAGCEFMFRFVDSVVDMQQIEDIAQEEHNSKVIVGLGGGSVCELTKLLSNKLGLSYVFIPTNPTTTAYFSNYAFVGEAGIVKKVSCKFAHKLLIDEKIISKAMPQSVKAGKEFILSFWEVHFNCQVFSLLFGSKVNNSGLSMLLAKLKDSHFFSKQNQGLLVMDMLVDLGYYIKDIDLSCQTALMLALMLKNTQAIGASFGKLCLVASEMLLSSYQKFFLLKKIETYSFLDFENLASSLAFLNIKPEKVNLANVKSIRNNHQLFLKLNAVKNQITSLVEHCLDEVRLFESEKLKTFYDLKKCTSIFKVLPYVFDCSPMTNVLSSSGLIVS